MLQIKLYQTVTSNYSWDFVDAWGRSGAPAMRRYHMTELLIATWLVAVHGGRPSLTRHLGQCTWLTPLKTHIILTSLPKNLWNRSTICSGQGEGIICDEFRKETYGLPWLHMFCELQPCTLQTDGRAQRWGACFNSDNQLWKRQRERDCQV